MSPVIVAREKHPVRTVSGVRATLFAVHVLLWINAQHVRYLIAMESFSLSVQNASACHTRVVIKFERKTRLISSQMMEDMLATSVESVDRNMD